MLTTAATPEQEERGVSWDGLAMWRMYIPYCYPLTEHSNASRWKKQFWHLQNLFNPANHAVMDVVLDEVRPDVVNIHALQGLGYNMLAAIAERKIPALYTLHDLGLACVRTQMFRNGQDCRQQCMACRLSGKYKASLVSKLETIGFCSPSSANLETLSAFFPVKNYPARVLLNPNQYPEPRAARIESDFPRILFAGQLSPHKGVSFLLKAMQPLAERFRFQMTVMGGGEEENELRARYEGASWCRFTGHVCEQDVSDAMVNSDVLCAPSLWTENSPGVVIHALLRGVPVIGSKKGGIPELVQDGVTGRLVEPGNAEAWQNAIRSVLESPSQLDVWRQAAKQASFQFDPQYLAEKYEEFLFELIRDGKATRS